VDHNFWAFVALGLLIAIPFIVILAKALGAGRNPGPSDLGQNGSIVGKRDT